jgi:hypothetical protein
VNYKLGGEYSQAETAQALYFLQAYPHPLTHHLQYIFINFTVSKERGHYCMSYTYVTVFIRNAAYLTHLLIKGPKFRNGNKNFDLKCPF